MKLMKNYHSADLYLCQHFCSSVNGVTHERLREMFYIHL